MTITTSLPKTILIRSHGGVIKEVQVLQLEREGFLVRFGFLNYTFHLLYNQLVRIEGNRIKKRFDWHAVDIEGLKDVYNRLTQKI